MKDSEIPISKEDAVSFTFLENENLFLSRDHEL